ncbi:hypothetical protein [Armatimonas sp.]|uniref:hypothetical protein n=1 Tax=Armatimonas sp. TaxID=1872638 RepID=UPI00374D4F76
MSTTETQSTQSTTETRRLFVRQLPPTLAELPSGATTPGESALPDATRQERFYTQALAQMEQVMPLQVAALRDQLDRVKAAQERFVAARTEELTWLQLHNEDARHAEEVIEEKLSTLRQKREALEQTHETRIEALLVQRASARQAAVAAFAVAGLGEGTLALEFGAEEEYRALPALESATATGSALAAGSVLAPRRQGFLHGLLQNNRLVPAPPAVADTLPEADTLTVSLSPSLPHRVLPEISLEEVSTLAAPKDALALQHGLPTSSPTLRALHDGQRGLEWVALVVCGSLFGISVGILTELLEPSRLFLRPEETLGPALVVAVIGIAVFWVLGRVSRGLLSLASECWHASLATRSQTDPAAVAHSLRRTSIASFGIAALLLVGLIVMEASVERYGILGALTARQANATLLQGGGVGQNAIPPAVLMAMALIVSAPFLLLHGLHGWVEGKAGALSSFLENRAVEAHWQAKQALHEKRTDELAPINSDLLRYRREELTKRAQETSQQETAQTVPEPSEEPESTVGAVAITVASPFKHSLIPEGNRLKLSMEHGWPLGSAVAAQLALAQAREAHALVRRAQAQKREALTLGEAEIQRWENQRQGERLELSAESKQRIDAAHAAYARAAGRFDTLYQQEWLRYEQLTRPGLLWRIRRFLWAMPGKEVYRLDKAN